MATDKSPSDKRSATTQEGEVALIVGGGPGVSASCARLFTQDGMQVAVAARNPDKPVLKKLAQEQGVHLYQCDASEPDAVLKLFQAVSADLGSPRLVVHNIDGRTQDIFRKEITGPKFGLRYDQELRVQRLSRRPTGGKEHARRRTGCKWPAGHHHLHQRECSI